MFIKHKNKIYKEVNLEELTKEELLVVARGVEVIEKEIVYIDSINKMIPPYMNPNITCISDFPLLQK